MNPFIQRTLAALAFLAVLQPAANAATFVLVHGAFADDHAWGAVRPLLEASGDRVVTVTLPGHGSDKTPLSQLSLDRYVEATESAIDGLDGKVVLVGHSLAGMVISQVAEHRPERIERLIYASAFLPQDGESAFDLLGHDKQSILGRHLKFSADKATAVIQPQGRVSAICADCPQAVRDHLANSGAAESMRPFADPVKLTDGKFGAVPKAYIFTTEDLALGHDAQAWMVQRNGSVQRQARFNTSHLPFLVDPKGFARTLRELAAH